MIARTTTGTRRALTLRSRRGVVRMRTQPSRLRETLNVVANTETCAESTRHRPAMVNLFGCNPCEFGC